MIRRYGERVRRDVRYRHRPSAYAVLPRGGRLLVTFQHAPEPEFQLPGGGVDPGESPVRALHREVREETGWTIARPVRLGAYRRFVYMPEYDRWAEKVGSVWLARPARRLGPPSEPGHTAVWLSPGVALERLANPGERDFLRRVLARIL